MNGETYNEPRFAKEIVGAGVISGVLGALVLVVAMLVVGLVVGVPPADFARGIAAVFRGEPAMVGGTGDVWLGLAVHLAVGALAGVLFAWLVGRTTGHGRALVSALIYALALWAVMMHVIVRAAAPAFATLADVVPWWVWPAVHLGYGLPLAASPALQRRLGREPGPRRASPHAWVGRKSQVPMEA
jgi:hypothetical protein